MALKSSKITSEVLQTCSRLLSSNADVTLRTIKIPAALGAQKHHVNEEAAPSTPSRFRYRIANTEKPVLPEINMRDEEESTPLFAHLQPGATPEFKFDFNPPKWAEKTADDSPFPATIRGKTRMVTIYTDQQKAEDKMLKYKLTYLQSQTRNYSTGHHYRHYSKGPAQNSGSTHCKKSDKCGKPKSKKACKQLNKSGCPSFKILDCQQSKGSKCKLNYLDPNCVKKFAPYPSYSEACAENLPDDPSECQQCPWTTCDSADTIVPGKPVRNRRSYSTSCSGHLDATAGVVLAPVNGEITEYLLKGKDGKCGQVKPPCKQPKGPCEIRREQEEMQRKIKDPMYKPDKKTAEGMVLIGDKEFILDAQFDTTDVNPLVMENKGSWIDVVGTGLSLDGKSSKNKPPNCPKHKKPKRPDIDQPMEKDLGIEYGNADWWSGRGKKSVTILEEESGQPGCRQENKCPNMKISSIKINGLLLSKKKGNKQKRIKGDEGHPPPCDEFHNPSVQCPEEPIKKPKYRRRPMNQGYYKRPEAPYNEDT